MSDLGLEERFRIFEFAAVSYAFQIQIDCALYSTRKLACQRGLANLTCADQRDNRRARQGSLEGILNMGSLP